jgi:hypothetical protein
MIQNHILKFKKYLIIICLIIFSLVFLRLHPAGVRPAPTAAPSVAGTAAAPTPASRTTRGPAAAASPAPPRESWPPKGQEAARATAIRDTIAALRAECRRGAGGDWDRWRGQLEGYRVDLKARIAAATPYNPTAAGYFEARSSVLEGTGDFPLFESAPDHYLRHVYEPESLDAFRREQPVVAGARWLKQRGIDVVFVAVPKMTEVYPEFFAASCPRDRIVAPQVRQALLELLEADIEVIDLLPAFLTARDTASEPLYQPADPHWAPRAQAIAARAIAERLSRYAFVKRALSEPAHREKAEAPYPPASSGASYEALNPDQRRRAEAIQPRSFLAARDAIPPPFDGASPIAFIGDSYNGGLMERVCLEINLPVNPLSGGGNTTDAFKNFLRDPAILKDCKVVVWLVCNSSLKAPWPLPPPIREAGAEAGR